MAAEPLAGGLPGVRVVICTFRSRDEVLEAVGSALEQGLEPEQVTVIDNASLDGTPELVGERFPRVRVMVNQSNLGFGRANNLAARDAGGQSLLLLNPDCQLREGAVRAMLAALDEDGTRGAISPRIDRPDGHLDLACRRSFPDPLTAFWRLSGLSRLRPQSRRFGRYNLTTIPPEQPMVVDAGSGACLLLPRTLWDSLGGFDESFFMYGEDLDLCWRLRELGRVVWYEPRARVVHHKGRSSRQVALPMLVAFHRSMWRFYRLHYLRGWQALLAPLVGLAILCRLSALLVVNGLRRRPVVSP